MRIHSASWATAGLLVLASAGSVLGAQTHLVCRGDIGSLSNASVTFTGKMVAGDIDNDYAPQCVSSVRLASEAGTAEGSIDGETGTQVIVSFENLQTAPEIQNLAASCESLGYGGGGECLTFERDVDGTKMTILGHDDVRLVCSQEPLSLGDCGGR